MKKEKPSSPLAGAYCHFEGRVRNHQDGRKVIALEYEACGELCEKEAEKILEEAQQKFSVIAWQCVHRVGRLSVGDVAVWVGVITEHRDQAFQVCRYVIDEVKYRLPIWKKEFYEDGNSGWVNCQVEGSTQRTHYREIQSHNTK